MARLRRLSLTRKVKQATVVIRCQKEEKGAEAAMAPIPAPAVSAGRRRALRAYAQ